MFVGETLGAVGGRLCPWQRGPHAESGLGVGVPKSGTPSHAENGDQALAASPADWRVLTPYRGIKHRLHVLHRGTFGSPPRERKAPLRAVQTARLLQAAAPVSATFAVPFCTRPDPGEDDVC